MLEFGLPTADPRSPLPASMDSDRGALLASLDRLTDEHALLLENLWKLGCSNSLNSLIEGKPTKNALIVYV